MPLTHLSYQILLALADAPRHGYGIIKEIEAREGEEAAPNTGALYLALQRLEGEGLIDAVESPELGADARRRYYRLTAQGREVAAAESARLAGLVSAAFAVSGAACGGGQGGGGGAGAAVERSFAQTCAKAFDCMAEFPAEEVSFTFEDLFTTSESACVAQFREFNDPADIEASVDAGRILFDASDATICLNAIAFASASVGM